MAERQDLEFTYSLIDRIVRISLGELADFSGAKYDGDFSLTLEQAHHRKNDDVGALMGLPPRDSDAWYLALLGRQFPGSWLPFGQEQLADCAEPHFRLVSSSNGRRDYIETIRQWNARIGMPGVRKTLMKLALLPRWLASSDFRLAFTSGVSANKACFERELLDHYRLVFEKH